MPPLIDGLVYTGYFYRTPHSAIVIMATVLTILYYLVVLLLCILGLVKIKFRLKVEEPV